MRKLIILLLTLTALAFMPSIGLCTTRALLVACKDFISQPNLGNAISGNLHMLGSALLGAGLRVGDLSVEDGTIGTVQALDASIVDAFSEAAESDLSILYLCTHGMLSSSDDDTVYLLLGNGQTESMLDAQALYNLLSGIQGEKLLILDACYSGALIGRGAPQQGVLPGAVPTPSPLTSPFLADPSIHVLTSADGYESSWYYDSEGLTSGAVSYFASALSSGLGLYGTPEADIDGDGAVTLSEMQRYLGVAVPSSTSQLLSTAADSLLLPVARGAMLSRPLTGFSYGSSLLADSDPTLDFSFTVTRGTSIQYRLIEYSGGRWNWENAITFLDEGDDESALLTAGRKSRSLTLDGVKPGDSGYLMLQVFSVTGSEVLLCSERLIAVQSEDAATQLALKAADSLNLSQMHEMPIGIRLGTPAEITVSVFDAQGNLVRRLASSQLTRPTPGDITYVYWDGHDTLGAPVSDGHYTITAEALVGATRHKTVADVQVGAGT